MALVSLISFCYFRNREDKQHIPLPKKSTSENRQSWVGRQEEKSSRAIFEILIFMQSAAEIVRAFYTLTFVVQVNLGKW